jgi:hypothetical protein
MTALLKSMRLWMVVCLLLLIAPAAVKAQCVRNAPYETTINVVNASSYFVTFYIDGLMQGTLPAGERSPDLAISPGEHLLFAHAIIDDEPMMTGRIITIPPGSICTWTLTNPRNSQTQSSGFRSSLVRQAVIPLTIPN